MVLPLMVSGWGVGGGMNPMTVKYQNDMDLQAQSHLFLLSKRNVSSFLVDKTVF